MPIALQIRRMTPAEWQAFSKRLYRVDDPETLRILSVRKPGEEQERRQVPRELTPWERLLVESVPAFQEAYHERKGWMETQPEWQPFVVAASNLLGAAELCAISKHQHEEWVIPDEAIRHRRRAEMTPEQRTAFDALDAQEDREAEAFLRDAFGYVTIPGRQIVVEGEEGQPEVVITDGATFLQYFGARRDLVRQITALVHNCNTLAQAEKNDSRSPSGSLPSSTEPVKAPLGPTPETTAAGVAEPGSAGTEDVMALTAVSPSGSTLN